MKTENKEMVVPLNKMFVDRSYQRMLREGRADRIATEFNSLHYRPVLLSARQGGKRDGMFAIIDGQHEQAGAAKRGDKTLKCLVVYGLTVQEEADLFRDRNKNQIHLMLQEDFRAGLRANDPECVGIAKVLSDYSLKVMTMDRVNGKAMLDTNATSVACIAKLIAIWRLKNKQGESVGPQLLARICKFITTTWNTDQKDRTSAKMFLALREVFRCKKWAGLDEGRLSTVLSKTTVNHWLAHARNMMDIIPKANGGWPLAYSFICAYNKHLSSKKQLWVPIAKPDEEGE